MRISPWKAIVITLVFAIMFPSLWAMASESLNTKETDLEYPRLKWPGKLQASQAGPESSSVSPTSLVRSMVGRPSSGRRSQFTHFNVFSLMSLGVVGLVAIKRRN
jgi:hypothetical protein